MSDIELSFNECAALVRKAARGAGLLWGLAEEAARAVLWLEARMRPGVASLIRYLAWRDGVDTIGAMPRLEADTWRPTADAICPIALGAFLSDAPDCIESFRAGPVMEPLLLTPFAAVSGRPYVLCWEDSDAGQPVMVHAKPGSIDLNASRSRVTSTLRDIATLHEFAARTHAPATETSRAGAGGGDAND